MCDSCLAQLDNKAVPRLGKARRSLQVVMQLHVYSRYHGTRLSSTLSRPSNAHAFETVLYPLGKIRGQESEQVLLVYICLFEIKAVT